MSKITSSKRTTFTAALLGKVANIRAQNSSSLSPELAGQVASLESASVADTNSVLNTHGRLSAALQTGAQEAATAADGIEATSGPAVSAAGLEAASIVMMGSGNLKDGYLGGSRASLEHMTQNSDINAGTFNVPGMNYTPSVALESFGEADVDQHTNMSIGYNFCAPQQDEFTALFYPAVVGTPDQVYWRVSARRPSVTYGAQHTNTGAATKYQKTNLLDAFRDHTVLENDDTMVVPFANPNNANDGHLIADGILDSVKVIRGVDVPTRPMAFNAAAADGIDLKGLASHPDLVKAGLLTQVDKIDTGARLAQLIIKVTDGTNTNYIRVNTSHVQGNNFNQVREGMAEETELRFRQSDFVLNCAQIKDVAGADIPALAAAKTNELSVSLPLRVDGELHLETGELSMAAKAVKIGTVVDASGVEVTTTAFDLVSFELVGFDLNSRFTNAGRRTIAILLDSDELSRNFYVPTLAPISLQRTVTNETQNRDTEDLLTATYAMMSNMSVTSLLNHVEGMKFYYNEAIRSLENNRTPDWRGSSFRGVGGLFMAPFFEKVDVDLAAVVNSITSRDKMADVRGFFVGLINEISYRMVTESGYLPALRCFTGDMKAKPKLLIGTDIYLPTFMFIPGDDRVAGPEMDHEIAQSYDNRMANKIILSLGGCGKANEIDVMGHGNMLYIPELVATVPMLRSGNTVKETMVQPRFFFLEHIPVCAEINVTNVQAVMAERSRLDVNHYTA